MKVIKKILMAELASGIVAVGLCSCGRMRIVNMEETLNLPIEVEKYSESETTYQETDGYVENEQTTEEQKLNDTTVQETVTETASMTPSETVESTASEAVTVPSAETKAPVISETEAITADNENSDESGVYWLVGSVKNIIKNAGIYAGSYGKTVYTVVKAYIGANPDTRFEGSLTDIMSIAAEINLLEEKLSKLNKSYDFPIAEMHDYALKRSERAVSITEAYSEEYSDDILGWLQQQYEAFKRVGKRKVYLAELDGEECLIMKEGKLNAPGAYSIYISEVGKKEVSNAGFSRELRVYYEISDELEARISSDYAEYLELGAELELKKDEMERKLNLLSDTSCTVKNMEVK